MDNYEKEFQESLGDPEKVEALYRRNKARFSTHLKGYSPSEAELPLLNVWRARLSYKSTFSPKLVSLAVVLALCCWIPIRIFLADSATSNDNIFRYFAPIFFACWGVAFAIAESRVKLILPLLAVSGLTALTFFLFPVIDGSQSRLLAFLHSYLLLWSITPLILNGFNLSSTELGRSYIDKTGEALCWAVLFLICGVVLSGITLGLFNALGIEVWDFYLKNVVTFGLVLAPFLGLYIASSSTDVRISPILAKVFAPVSAATVTAFFFAVVFSYSRLFTEKDAFVFYSITPIFIMAILFFVNTKDDTSRFMLRLNLYLSVITTLFVVMVVPPALFRIASWGFTPNKIAILGIEVILLVNIVTLIFAQVEALRTESKANRVQETMVKFLPIYVGWSLIMVVVVPLAVGFK